MNQEVLEHGIDQLKDDVGIGEIGCELHNALYNSDYFIIGHYEAEEFLKRAEGSVFNAIDIVNEYERDRFGELCHNGNGAEGYANMYAYIEGENILSESETLHEKWDEELTGEDIKAIIKELS